VEPADAFASRRLVYLRWTAHDAHLPSRPIALWYHTSFDQVWHLIDAALPNTGRYDWRVPAEVAGQMTLKIAVRDLGGHVVERLHGPVPLDRWLCSPMAQTPPVTQPAGDPASALAESSPPPTATQPSRAQRRQAEQLHQQAAWHLARGQYDLAVERLHEALEIDPEMLSAINDLAGIYYLQKDYPRAIEQYQAVLKYDGGDAGALRGVALAYVAQRQYPQSRQTLQRLLAINSRNAEAWLDLGDVLFMMGSQTEAISHWKQATAVDAAAQEIIRKARRRLELYGSGNVTETADRTGNRSEK